MECECLMEAGTPWPRGVHAQSKGCNIAVFSSQAQAIGVCLFDRTGTQEVARHWLEHKTSDVWHGFLPILKPGDVYGLCVQGSNNILLDPYAREIVHTPAGPRGRVPATHIGVFNWANDAPPRVPLADTVLYELHVKGFSQTNTALPEHLRGTYAGLAHPNSIAYLKQLGVTSLSLLPVHASWDEARLQALGLRNYWGYNTLGYFAPEPRLAAQPDDAINEFRDMVRALHAAGLEVILDVVFNHSAESDVTGPTLHFRALDNAAYYRVNQHDPKGYDNYSGCGNTLNIQHPAVLQLVLDSLRYWVQEMHVDGFRFDLAPVLGRNAPDFDRQHVFFQAIAQDPVLQRVKLIAEPWDLGPQGYQLGNFPAPWLEWNDRFRDTLRSYWISPSGSQTTRGEFAMRFCGSADVFASPGRLPNNSVNFITAHDGFTLRDLVRFNERNNFANGERNCDGHAHNLSRDCGHVATRIARALLACNLLAQGTPMLCAGDEIGKTQDGNNNAYCQDNAISWLDWPSADSELLAFTQEVLALRAREPLLRTTTWFATEPCPLGKPQLQWRLPNGQALTTSDWHDTQENSLLALINNRILLAFNPCAHAICAALPSGRWRLELDSSLDARMHQADHLSSEHHIDLPAHSLRVLRLELP
jgi:glycogen debranching enzyme GlgX